MAEMRSFSRLADEGHRRAAPRRVVEGSRCRPDVGRRAYPTAGLTASAFSRGPPDEHTRASERDDVEVRQRREHRRTADRAPVSEWGLARAPPGLARA